IVELAMRIMLVEGNEPDRMFDMIENKMGTVGPDILYELVATKGGSRASKRGDARRLGPPNGAEVRREDRPPGAREGRRRRALVWRAADDEPGLSSERRVL